MLKQEHNQVSNRTAEKIKQTHVGRFQRVTLLAVNIVEAILALYPGIPSPSPVACTAGSHLAGTSDPSANTNLILSLPRPVQGTPWGGQSHRSRWSRIMTTSSDLRSLPAVTGAGTLPVL
jgi:hypothetical protein